MIVHAAATRTSVFRLRLNRLLLRLRRDGLRRQLERWRLVEARLFTPTRRRSRLLQRRNVQSIRRVGGDETRGNFQCGGARRGHVCLLLVTGELPAPERLARV